MKRLGKVVNERSSENVYPLIYDMLPNKIVAAIEEVDTLVRLVETLNPELRILYILHTTRGEGDVGRYESPDLTVAEVVDFIQSYRDFLSGDCRFDIWVHSMADNAQIVFDRHNLLHCYGSTDSFEKVLMGQNYTTGKITVPVPHEHYYNKEFDGAATKLLSEFDWTRKDLNPIDVQF